MGSVDVGQAKHPSDSCPVRKRRDFEGKICANGGSIPKSPIKHAEKEMLQPSDGCFPKSIKLSKDVHDFCAILFPRLEMKREPLLTERPVPISGLSFTVQRKKCQKTLWVHITTTASIGLRAIPAAGRPGSATGSSAWDLPAAVRSSSARCKRSRPRRKGGSICGSRRSLANKPRWTSARSRWKVPAAAPDPDTRVDSGV
jgi:hypothetical protein